MATVCLEAGTVSETRRLVLTGSFFAFLSVAIGAFGAHAMKARLDATGMRSVFETGVQYHMFHALAILVLASLSDRVEQGKRIGQAAVLFSVGIVLFAGSLYALALTGIKIFGAVTPFGGLSFLLGWVMVAASAKRDP